MVVILLQNGALEWAVLNLPKTTIFLWCHEVDNNFLLSQVCPPTRKTRRQFSVTFGELEYRWVFFFLSDIQYKKLLSPFSMYFSIYGKTLGVTLGVLVFIFVLARSIFFTINICPLQKEGDATCLGYFTVLF